MNIDLSPLIPLLMILVLSGLGLILIVTGLVRGGHGARWRLLALTILVGGLFEPSTVREDREQQTDVVVVAIDRSASQLVGERAAQTDKAVTAIRSRVAEFEDLEILEIEVTNGPTGGHHDAGTQMITALRSAIGTVPSRRLAGAVLITDGQIHDLPVVDDTLASSAPVHFLLSGAPGEIDRRLVIDKAPAFGIVGQQGTVSYRVEEQRGMPKNPGGNLVWVTLKDGDQVLAAAQVQVGRKNSFTFPLEHAGPRVLNIDVEALPGELSTINNRALVTINGVRDRLQVLLVSGQPHAGERTWRNLLKSDPAVDLVHFTILRPPEKDDFTPLNEIALIAFPARELFKVKLNDFDLVIFDRYIIRDVLPPSYLANIVTYVKKGGALLVAVGPEYASTRSLFKTPLVSVLPAAPTGQVIQAGFQPRLTDVGRRHPVTANLTNAGVGGKSPSWGRWFRQIAATVRAGHTVMEGGNGRPLLVLDRFGEGRVAVILSDHIWLWARGYEGGGPQAELLRRLAHWLMKEPDLEEEALSAVVRDGKLRVQRNSLFEKSVGVTVTLPSGRKRSLVLGDRGKGFATAALPVNDSGLYRIEDGRRTVLAVAGALNPVEFADLRATANVVAPLAQGSGGGIHWINKSLPSLRRVRPGRDSAGSGWIGLRANNSYIVTGVSKTPLLPPLILFALALLTMMVAWWREGR